MNHRAVIENSGKITFQDLKTWGFLTIGYKSGILTFSINGKEAGSLKIAVNINQESKSYIEFDYLLNNKPVKYSHTIELFPCNYGKYRYYFICRDTGKRVTALYMSRGYYSSRHFHKMVYECSREHRSWYELLDKSRNLKKKVEWYKQNGHPKKAKKYFYKVIFYESNFWKLENIRHNKLERKIANLTR